MVAGRDTFWQDAIPQQPDEAGEHRPGPASAAAERAEGVAARSPAGLEPCTQPRPAACTPARSLHCCRMTFLPVPAHPRHSFPSAPRCPPPLQRLSGWTAKKLYSSCTRLAAPASPRAWCTPPVSVRHLLPCPNMPRGRNTRGCEPWSAPRQCFPLPCSPLAWLGGWSTLAGLCCTPSFPLSLTHLLIILALTPPAPGGLQAGTWCTPPPPPSTPLQCSPATCTGAPPTAAGSPVSAACGGPAPCVPCLCRCCVCAPLAAPGPPRCFFSRAPTHSPLAPPLAIPRPLLPRLWPAAEPRHPGGV